MDEKKIIVIGPEDALFIIDLLKDFDKGGALPVVGVEDEIDSDLQIDGILSLLDLPFGLFVFTGDEHPSDHIEHTIYGQHALAGTKGAKMIEKVQQAFDALPEEKKLWYTKGQDRRLIGYSIAFSLYYAGLIERLRKNGFERLFFCGRAFTHCVGESAIDARGQISFEVFVIKDLSLSLPKPYGDIDRMKKLLGAMKIPLINSVDLR
jgi:nicotinamidase-related amidase